MSSKDDFWVIGIGASAGGLEALSTFFKVLPERPNAAFIIAQHLAPHAKSMMVELISRQTKMTVIAVKDHLQIKPGLICIVPPNFDVTTVNDELRLTKAGEETRPKPSVDTFFQSLAKVYGRRSVGIILSGTGSDGAQGIRAIKEAGGVSIVQDWETAKYDGMPRSAFDTGMVDAVLPPEQIAVELFSILNNRNLTLESETLSEDDDVVFNQILLYLKKEMGTDFTQYKISTIQRRMEKRIQVLKAENIKDYFKILKGSSEELLALSQNLLVSVTSFFRDTDAYEALALQLEEIISKKNNFDELRIWSAGCATGEEPYSIAILVLQICERLGKRLALKIFASDLDTDALAYARNGLYTPDEVSKIDNETLNDFFELRNKNYEIKKSIKDMIVFARQDLVQNPPFVKLDLISCRNVLIYFETQLQNKIFDIFHYALKPNGILFLGKSESTNATLFEAIDKKEKLFRRLNVMSGVNVHIPSRYITSRPTAGFTKSRPAEISLAETAGVQLLQMMNATGAVVDGDGTIIQMLGDISEFVNFPTSGADFRLQNLLPKSASLEFSVLLKKAAKEVKICKSRFFKLDKNPKKSFSLSIKLLESFNNERPFFVVLFEMKKLIPEMIDHLTDKDRTEGMAAIEQELIFTKENLQTVIEELETSNEELQSLNEEFSSTNEELQSSNEELETTNEELQSTNEELITLNEELSLKSQELRQAYASLENIQASITSPLIVIDRDLRVIRFNHESLKIFNFSHNDINHPITEASCYSEIADFEVLLKKAIEDGKTTEALCDTGKRLYQMRVSPNRDEFKKIIGAIIVFYDNTEFLQAQDKLKSSDKRIRAVIDSSPTLIALKDNMGKYLVVNQAFCDLFKIKEEDILGKTDREIFPEELSNGFRENDLEVILRKKPTEMEENIFYNNRNYKLHTNRFPLIENNERNPYAVGFVALDVTTQFHAQENLKASENRYKAIIEDQTVFVCRHKPDGNLTFSNQIFKNFFSTSEDVEDFYGIINPLDLKRVKAELEKINFQNPVIQYEHRTISLSNGSFKWIRWIHRGIFDDKHKLIEFQAVGFDTTEVHNQTQELLDKDSLYSHVLEHTSDYLSVYRKKDDSFYLEFFNQSAKNALIGNPRLIGKSVEDLHDLSDSTKILENFNNSLKSDKSISFEESIESVHGDMHLSTTIVPVTNLEEGIERVVAISRDITKLKRIEKALREETHNAEAANSAKSNFLASMSHELRTPLNVIMGMSQLLMRGDLKPEQARLMASIQRAGKTLLALIEDVLDLSKIEAGKIDIEARPFNLSTLIKDIIQSFESQVTAKGLQLNLESELDDNQVFLGDEVRIKQIMDNLLSNALKFTEKGSITVHVDSIRSVSGNYEVHFEVRDSGIGIPENVHDKIFKRFSQADSGISRKFGGSGLGLSISKQLVELMHGSIGFNSTDKGSTFWFRIEFPESSVNLPATASADISYNLKNLKVLIVEDNQESLKLMKLMFENFQGDAVGVENGLDALSLVKDNTFDIVIMDMQMPVMNGLETTKAIRNLGNKKSNIPIIGLTANAMPGDKENCLMAGMNDYLSKPVDFNELLKKIKKWV